MKLTVKLRDFELSLDVPIYMLSTIVITLI